VKLVADKKLHLPEPFRVYGVSEIEHVLRLFQSGRNIGKMAIELRSEEPVNVRVARAIQDWY
jgi:hypothetical protein